MKNDKIKNHIYELYLQSGMQSKEFEERICDSINSDVNAAIKIPDHSTMVRWHNGETVPNANMFPYIAKALGVSEEEIRLGEKPETDLYKEQLKQVNDVMNLNEVERQKLSRLLFLSKYVLRLFAAFLLSYGLFLLNATLWQNGLLYLIPLVIIIILVRYDRKKNKDFFRTEKEKGFVQRSKEDLEFFKYILQKELVSRLCLNMMILITFIIFLPALETHFYRGKFYITCTVYFFTGALLLYRSYTDK